MVEPAILTALGWLVSPLVKILLEKGWEYLGTGTDRRKEMLGATALPFLSLAIEAAEKSPKKDLLQLWLQRLKDAYYEAEEAIDLFEYEKLKQKVKDERKTFRQKIKNERKTSISLLSGILPRRLKFSSSKLKSAVSVFNQQKFKLKGSIDKLLEIAKEAKEFRDLFLQGDDQHPDRETTSRPPNRVFGREKDKENIVSLLSRKPKFSEPGPSNLPGIHVVAITGRSGVGKTTLAQFVYDYFKGMKIFDLFIWVHVPRKFKAADVIIRMISNIRTQQISSLSNNYRSSLETRAIELNNLTQQISSLSNHYSSSLETLTIELNNLWSSKKVLLVLDDLWFDTEEDKDQWEKLVVSINSWSPESKILVTTQSYRAANQTCIAKENIYQLKQLEEDDLFELFMHYALPIDSPMKEELKIIGRKITAKLKGDPNAAKLLGSQMREKIDVKHWVEISNKDWLGDNMKARIWSYQQLPTDLQRCFAFCSLFPKGFVIPGRILIDLWMAEGFIKSKHNSERMEDIAKNYLDELVYRFFLERQEGTNGEDHYVLHDLLHDLAEQVGSDDYIRVEDKNSREIPSDISCKLSRNENVRHLSLNAGMTNKIKDELSLKKNLRTLIIEGDNNDAVSEKDLEEILRNFRKLRVLHIPLRLCQIEALPDCIGNLKHLRFLSIGDGPFRKLPDSICQLYHLQFLALSSCKVMPVKFSELVSLRHIYTDEPTVSNISNVGRLTSLQNLSDFCIKPEDGHELRQLESLADLRGSLHIKGLENVKCKEDAVKARLVDKNYLKGLELEWNGNRQATNDAEILEALKPHPNVRKLGITRYKGRKLPDWLLSQNSGSCLDALGLWDCDGIEELSYINQCLPKCKHLVLGQLDGLKKFPILPSELKFAYVELPLLLCFVTSDDLQMEEERKRSTLEVAKQIAEHSKLPEALLPSNILLTIQGHVLSIKKKLKAAPQIRTSPKCQNFLLKIGSIESINDLKNVSWVELLDVWAMGMDCQLEMMFHRDDEVRLDLPSSLTSVAIVKGSITNQALSMSLEKLVLLTELCLKAILTITSLPPQQVLCALKNLQKLEIEECYLLTSLGGIEALTSLRNLKLRGCPEFKSQDSSLLPSNLEDLEVIGCANIEAIIKRSTLPNMHTLKIWFCPIQKIHLNHLSSMKELNIAACPQLSSLEGLSSLSGLNTLYVLRCPRIGLCSPEDKTSSLKSACTDNPSLLQLMLSDEAISKLEGFLISNFDRNSIADDVFDHLASLKWLRLNDSQITSLPKNLKDLATLQSLCILKCPNLQELTALPESLRRVEIKDCPILKERCKRNGPDWHIIAHIANKIINW